MPADSVNKTLKFNPPVLYKIFFKPSSNLFLRERRDGNDGSKLSSQPLMQPVKMFVPPRYLDIVKLDKRFLTIYIFILLILIRTLGVSW